jgi:hypothetical protein
MPSGAGRRDHALERPVHALHLEDGAGLAAGCTVILKPPEWAPLSCSLLADLTVEAGFPPGVFNVVQGIGEEAGAALVSSTGVRPHQLHRFARDRALDRPGGRCQHRAVHRRAGRQRATDRVRRLRPGRGRGQAAGQYDDAGPGVPGRHPPAG